MILLIILFTFTTMFINTMFTIDNNLLIIKFNK